jgi:predicted glycoside hydrolase/deacetylase ChbG (UPF0249 family)
MAEATICMTELQAVNFYQFICKARKLRNSNAENIRCLHGKFNCLVMWHVGFIDPYLRLSSYAEQGNMYKTDCDYCIKIIHEENLPDASGKTF